MSTVGERKILEVQREFAFYVNRVLGEHIAPIQEFCLDLCCYECFDPPSDLFSWISFGFRQTVRKFSFFLNDGVIELPLSQNCCNVAVLDLRGEGDSGEIRLDIPASASLCFPSVESLYLHGVTPIIGDNSSISFPNLKIMNLRTVLFQNEDSIHKFLSSSPVLDELIIDNSPQDDIDCLTICIPSLTRLTVKHDCVHKFKIDSPALQYLLLEDDMPGEYLPGESLSFLLEADVNIYLAEFNVENHISIINFLGRLTKVKFLSTTGEVLKVFALANIPLGFPNLTRLEIKRCDCINLCAMIINLLGRMDNLEHIIVQGDEQPSCFCSPSCHQPCWTEPQIVPNCLLLRVTTVSISYMFIHCCDQFEAMKYILKNSKILQLLSIDLSDISKKKQLEIVKKIELLPRGSLTCQLAFT